MPMVERICLEPMQPTDFFGRNRTIYLCYSPHINLQQCKDIKNISNIQIFLKEIPTFFCGNVSLDKA